MNSITERSDIVRVGARDYALIVPYTVLLTPQGWHRDEQDVRKWRQYRFLFYCRFLGAADHPLVGEKLKVIESPEGVDVTQKKHISATIEVADEKSTLYGVLREETFIHTAATELSAKLGHTAIPALSVGASARDEVKQSITQKVSSSAGSRIIATEKHEEALETEVSYKGGSGILYAAAVYEEWTYGVTLQCVDYLDIKYSKRSPIAFYYRKQNHPNHAQFGNDRGRDWRETGPNILWLHHPWGKVSIWHPLHDSIVLRKASDYANQVPTPHEPVVSPANGWKDSKIRPLVDCDSLYELSHMVFPAKAREDFFA
ncbi:hypothetical protein JS756_33890 [Streptomyces actuosus]|uniref:Uncharacterized protein n=1 Tax=Streptomyces actuosus TaxID=1885 RepID=A0ABS2W1K4_STRAS|nr:hypothetical protein [Streptomyces actuosus]MBN0048990.1 hypothetical protein [Streptomyces actuosus]